MAPPRQLRGKQRKRRLFELKTTNFLSIAHANLSLRGPSKRLSCGGPIEKLLGRPAGQRLLFGAPAIMMMLARHWPLPLAPRAQRPRPPARCHPWPEVGSKRQHPSGRLTDRLRERGRGRARDFFRGIARLAGSGTPGCGLVNIRHRKVTVVAAAVAWESRSGHSSQSEFNRPLAIGLAAGSWR